MFPRHVRQTAVVTSDKNTEQSITGQSCQSTVLSKGDAVRVRVFAVLFNVLIKSPLTGIVLVVGTDSSTIGSASSFGYHEWIFIKTVMCRMHCTSATGTQ